MSGGRRIVLSCMRNEGMWLLEWIAYYRAIGFDRAVVVTNNCTDGTDLMLDRLDTMGLVTHLRNDWRGDGPPQMESLRIARAHPVVEHADWCLHVDADEFLNVHHGDGMVDDLIAAAPEADCIAVAWRMFGNSGHTRWPGGLLMEACTWARGEPSWNGSFHKALFRPAQFAAVYVHMPKHPIGPRPKLVSARGVEIHAGALFRPDQERHRRMDRGELNWEGAQINHYAVRSDDVYLMKNDRGAGNAKAKGRHFLNNVFYVRANQNQVEDRTIQRHLPRVHAILEELRADPILHHLDRFAHLWFEERRDRVVTPEQIAEWSLTDDEREALIEEAARAHAAAKEAARQAAE